MKKRSLVLITVDCLRADHVGFNGYSRPVTSFLDSLAKNSAAFSQAIVAGAPTYFSFPAIMASRHALALGRKVLGIAPGEPTIATTLRECGYATAAFLAGNPYLSPRFGYDQGFDEFRDSLNSEPTESSSPTAPVKGSRSEWNHRIEAISRRTQLTATAYEELYFWYCQWYSRREQLSLDQLRRYPAAHVIVDQACAWLDTLGGEPFFLWLHLMDPHHPYYPPQEALSALGLSRMSARRARFLNSFWNRGDVGPERLRRYREEILSLYDAGVFWVDLQISRLVAALQQRQCWDETVFVVTADHGEEFLEHDARYHSPTGLPEQLVRVPLLLRAPELSRNLTLREPFSLIQLAPTLFQALQIPVPEPFRGRGQWEQIQSGELLNEPVIVECLEGCNNPFRAEERIRPRLLAVRESNHKLVIHFNQSREELYDLKEDPEEKSPVSDLNSKRAKLLRVAQSHLQQSRLNRDATLVARARIRELRQSLRVEPKAAQALVTQ